MIDVLKMLIIVKPVKVSVSMHHLVIVLTIIILVKISHVLNVIIIVEIVLLIAQPVSPVQVTVGELSLKTNAHVKMDSLITMKLFVGLVVLNVLPVKKKTLVSIVQELEQIHLNVIVQPELMTKMAPVCNVVTDVKPVKEPQITVEFVLMSELIHQSVVVQLVSSTKKDFQNV